MTRWANRWQPMGHQNLDRVLLAQPPIRLPPQTRLCLLLMARVAHDKAPLYWGGVTWLQMNMGYAETPAGRRQVMTHLRRLESAGYLTRTDKKRGHRAVYELHLPGLTQPVDNHGAG